MNEGKAAVPSTILCSTQFPQPPSSPTNTCGWKGNGGNEKGSREKRKVEKMKLSGNGREGGEIGG